MIQLDGKSHMLLLDYVLLEYKSSLFMITMESNNGLPWNPHMSTIQPLECGKRFAFNVNLKDTNF
jgi:hypothetical protein